MDLQRRKLLAGLAATPLALAAGCRETARYTQADAHALDDQRMRDALLTFWSEELSR